MEGALRVQERPPPAQVLIELLAGRLGARPGVGQPRPLIEVGQPLGVFGHEVVFEELLEHLGELAPGLNRVENVPGPQVTDGGRTFLESGVIGEGRFGVPLQRDGGRDAAAAEAHGQLEVRRPGQVPETERVGRRGTQGRRGGLDQGIGAGAARRGLDQMEGGVATVDEVRRPGRVGGVGGGGPIGGRQGLLEVAVGQQVGGGAVVGGSGDQADLIEVGVSGSAEVDVELRGGTSSRDGDLAPDRAGVRRFVEIFDDLLGRELLLDVGVGAEAGEPIQLVGCRAVGDAVEQGAGAHRFVGEDQGLQPVEGRVSDRGGLGGPSAAPMTAAEEGARHPGRRTAAHPVFRGRGHQTEFEDRPPVGPSQRQQVGGFGTHTDEPQGHPQHPPEVQRVHGIISTGLRRVT